MNIVHSIVGLLIGLGSIFKGSSQEHNVTYQSYVISPVSTAPVDYTQSQNLDLSPGLKDPERSANDSFRTVTPAEDLNLPAQRTSGQSRRLSTSHKMNRLNETSKSSGKTIVSANSSSKNDDVYDKVKFEGGKNNDNMFQTASTNSSDKRSETKTQTPAIATANGTVVTFDERSNFDGPDCPTGYVKINGKCVERDDK